MLIFSAAKLEDTHKTRESTCLSENSANCGFPEYPAFDIDNDNIILQRGKMVKQVMLKKIKKKDSLVFFCFEIFK